jgi:anti-sigma-K factor RskA
MTDLNHIPFQNDDPDADDVLERALGKSGHALPQDAVARREIAQTVAGLAALGADVPQVKPSDALRAKVLGAAVKRSTPSVVPRNNAADSNRFIRVLGLAASVAAVILLASNVYFMNRLSELEGKQDAMMASMAHDADMMVAMIAEGQKTPLADDSGQERATVVWMAGAAQGMMITQDLPMLSPDLTYQLWLIGPDGVPVSAGTFSVDTDGTAHLMFDAGILVEGFNAFGISVEPMGGSEQPTTTPLAIGQRT